MKSKRRRKRTRGRPRNYIQVECPYCLSFFNRNEMNAHLRDDHPEEIDLSWETSARQCESYMNAKAA